MLQLRILMVGKTERGFVQDGVAYYLERLRPFAHVETVEVRAAAHSGRDAGQAVEKESAALLARLPPGDPLILLDERGRELDTREFSAWLTRLGGEAQGVVHFAIGGAYGVGDTVRQHATATLALSRMTLPHQLVRVVLLEQLYRALSLAAGHGYHHA
jgi:23S rRNA (pseudouridine1915-N3)-methyltransferase